MVNILGFSYKDVMEMPTYERRFYIDKYKELKEIESNSMGSPSNSSGKRTKSYTPGINGPKTS